jgi:hypothetical protein
MIYVQVFGATLLGLALRTLGPYLVSSLQIVAERGTWTPWPRFEPKYLVSLLLAIGGYVVALLTIQGAFEQLMALPFVVAVGLAYSGQGIAREGIKTVVAIGQIVRK